MNCRWRVWRRQRVADSLLEVVETMYAGSEWEVAQENLEAVRNADVEHK